jgi:hypothetical protein
MSMVVLLMHPSAPNVCTEMPRVACATSMLPSGSHTIVRTCFSPPASFIADHPDAAVYWNRKLLTPLHDRGRGSCGTVCASEPGFLS